jgi:multisubunit Na+/H+ antiporter MnhF subunit
VNAFLAASTVLLAALAPLGATAVARRPIDGLVALELGSALVVLDLVCLAVGLHRDVYFGVAVVAALMSWIGGLVIARFLGRWL